MRALSVFVAAAALALAGCVAPIDPRPTVSELSEATKAARTAMQDYDRDLVAYRNAEIRARALADPLGVQAAAGTCIAGATACRVVVTLADRSLSDLSVPSALGNTLAALDEIVLYMETLGVLAAAESDADIEAAANRASKSVATLASLAAVAVPGAAGLVPFAQPVGRALAWVAGQALEQAKLVALRNSTARMDSVLGEAMVSFAKTADAAHEIKVAAARDTTFAALGLFNRAGGEANLASLVKAAAATDALAAAAPGQLFLDLADAHKAFAAALAAPVFSRENVRIAIAKMQAQASRVARIVKALQDAQAQS